MSSSEQANKERVEILIDGGNFYHLALKRLGCHDSDFDFEKFAQFLTADRELVENGKRYYIGTVRERQDFHETTKAMSAQTSLFGRLEQDNWCIKTSKLRTRTETIKIDDRVRDYTSLLSKGISSVSFQRSREKGIDVKLAVDLLIGAYDDKYDTAIIISSDTDLIPVIDIIRKKLGKKVEYVGFSSPEIDGMEAVRPTNAMIHKSDTQRVLPVEDLKEFILEDNTSESEVVSAA